MRVALKIAYIGSNYHGSQVQPNVPTVEGELFKALTELEIIKDPKSANFISSGRTDAGVHAMGQVVAFDTDVPNLAIPRVINSKLPGTIWAWAHSLVPDNFDPRRHAVSRTYRYIMCGEQYDISRIRSASKLLHGTHDFSNFCTNESGRGTVRTVERIDVRVSGNLTRIDVEANSFLWNMVRKIVTALMMVGSGVRDEEWLEQMLDPDSYEEGLGSAHAYGLVFMDVNYPIPIEWIEDGYAIRRAHERVHDHLVRYRVMADVLEHLLPIVPPSDEI
ncbi:tRNA pseudouridine(38-40) synthase TruA [Methanococcoides methylutens]|uniref:tRNA pseudouridine synthase A n=1 Tax=Methanococcoides methylutens MM1 TaxID=1434104 RepID=A0A0E3X0T0_METMT|nr:tRNA pseudouridine(38-40) synthase TruA [Methanococcoides methylutens]AKB86175.1 tRNA pseudouridine synthase A [Methanococcoides methylutens MM1]